MSGALQERPQESIVAIGEDLHRVLARLAPGLRVIPGREAALLDALRREIARLDASCAELATGLNAARAAAEAEGRAAGYDAGRAAAAAMIAEARRHRDEVINGVQDEAVDLAFGLAARLIDREIARDPALVRACVASWRRAAAIAGACTVALHPDDAAAFTMTGMPGDGVRVVPDNGVRRGSCRIESAGGACEAGFDLQLGEVRDAIC